MSITKQKLIVILGPTASGKSEFSIHLAQKFGGYIISADARQIYKEMNIGTAKLKPQEFQGIPHFLINVVKPNQDFSVAEYQKKVFDLIRRKKGLPFLTGGTGLYISAIVDNLQIPPGKPNKALRKKLEKKSLSQLYKQLRKLDFKTAGIIDKNNKRRLIRALEVCLTTKKTFSAQRLKGKPLFDVLQIGLKIPREKLYKKINQRVDKMIKQRLVSEVKKLGKKYGFNKIAMSGIGYKQIGLYIKGKFTKEEAVLQIKKDTRHYAKKQLAWFRRDKKIKWIKNQKEAKKLIEKFLKNY